MTTTPRRRRLLLGVASVLTLATSSACLAPGAPDPTGHAPFGSLEVNGQAGAGIRVAGWTIDPDTAAPIDVQVKVEGLDVRNVRADGFRPDVGAAHPGYGDAHGFDLTVPDLGPGKRQVCVWVNNVGHLGDTRVLGCKDIFISVEPLGTLEWVSGSPDGRIRATGWVGDPETTGPTPVGIVADGAVVTTQLTDVPRPEPAAFGLGLQRGFDISFPAPVGRHTVCAVAGNVGRGSARFVGCAEVVVPAANDRRPDLRLSAVEPIGGGSARVRGTVSDPDGPGPITVQLRVDGVDRSTVAVGGAFEFVVTGLGRGRHDLCAWAVDVPGAAGTWTGDRMLPCSSVVIGGDGVPSIGTVGAATTSVGVGPGSGSPIAGVDRDAGVSVSLRDGSTLWLFGDSSETDAAGNLRYFVNNTAAWAPSGLPASTRDAAVGGSPVRFATPSETFSCPPARPSSAMWPMSAVATPSGSRDLVTAFFAQVCLGPGFLNMEARGVAVVQWSYDPSAPPVGVPIVGTVRAHDLFPAVGAYGSAAVAVADAGAGSGDAAWFVYGYQCTAPQGAGPFWPAQYGPCTVGRVPVTSVAERSQWRFWNGSSWVSNASQAAAVLPAGGADPAIPVAAFNVAHDPAIGAYVMAYSPWPGFIDRVYVRVSSSPVGPWSDPVSIQLPSCNDSVGTAGYWCYAGSAQPRFSLSASGSGPSAIGLGHYDQLITAMPIRGQYRATTVPFAIRS